MHLNVTTIADNTYIIVTLLYARFRYSLDIFFFDAVRNAVDGPMRELVSLLILSQKS